MEKESWKGVLIYKSSAFEVFLIQLFFLDRLLKGNQEF